MNKADRQKINDHIARVQFKIVDTAEHILDIVAADLKKPAAGPKAPATVTRRQIANMLRVSQFCALRACRRSHCCRGEPAHCLQAIVPLLPAQAFDGLLRVKRPRGAARQNHASLRP
jgi:hypothetical protein